MRRIDSEQTGQVLDSYRRLAAPPGKAQTRGGEAVPSTFTTTTRWRFASLMLTRPLRPPSRGSRTSCQYPSRTASASRADPGGGEGEVARRARTGNDPHGGRRARWPAGGRRGSTASEIASRAFDVVVAGLVVWPVLAAVASAIRVVATNAVGCTDAIEDGVTGLLVPPRDFGALVAALLRYVDGLTLRRQQGRAAAREHVARMFRQAQIWEALHDEYHWLMRGKA